MRAVTTATAAAVLRLDRKAFDNLLSRIGPDALPAGRQGVERRIPLALVEMLFLVNELSSALRIPAKEAFALAQQLLARSQQANIPGADRAISLSPFLSINADLDALRAEMTARYVIAVESTVRPTRGRRRRRELTVSPDDRFSDLERA